jgi:hypothetical protein
VLGQHLLSTPLGLINEVSQSEHLAWITSRCLTQGRGNSARNKPLRPLVAPVLLDTPTKELLRVRHLDRRQVNHLGPLQPLTYDLAYLAGLVEGYKTVALHCVDVTKAIVEAVLELDQKLLKASPIHRLDFVEDKGRMEAICLLRCVSQSARSEVHCLRAVIGVLGNAFNR